MKVYADEPGAFDADAEQRLALFAAQAAVLVANVQSAERARRLSDEHARGRPRAATSVSMAKGVLMGRDGVDEDTALRLLLRPGRAGGTDRRRGRPRRRRVRRPTAAVMTGGPIVPRPRTQRLRAAGRRSSAPT